LRLSARLRLRSKGCLRLHGVAFFAAFTAMTPVNA
jgi:hypothetical protein